jgi:hypothetical protein
VAQAEAANASETLGAGLVYGAGVSEPVGKRVGNFYLGSGNQTTGTAPPLDAVSYSDHTFRTVAAGLRRTQKGNAVASDVEGFLVGWYGVGTQTGADIEGLSFADETYLTSVTTLGDGRQNNANLDSADRGYLIGGQSAAGWPETYPLDNWSFIYATRTLDTTAGALAAEEPFPIGLSADEKGYVVTGTTVGSCAIKRFSYITETFSSVAASISPPRMSFTSAFSYGNSKGYVAGGEGSWPTLYASIFGLDYSTEAGSFISATLSQEKAGGAGAQSSVSGYSAGGRAVYFADPTYIDRLRFSDETAFTLDASLLSHARYNTYAFSTPDEVVVGAKITTNGHLPQPVIVSEHVISGAGYRCGGTNSYGDPRSEIDKIRFSDETLVNLVAALSAQMDHLVGFSSTSNGYTKDENEGFDKLTFSTETSTGISVSFAFNRSGPCSMEASTKGYIAAGYYGYPEVCPAIESFAFSTEATAVTSSTLAQDRAYTAAASFEAKSFVAGGYYSTLGVFLTSIESFDHSSEAVAAVSDALDLGLSDHTAVSSSETGYFLSGQNPDWNPTSVIQRFVVSTETVSTLSATLSEPRPQASAVQSSHNGYTLASYFYDDVEDQTYNATTERLSFATETSIPLGSYFSESYRYGTGVSSPSAPLVTETSDSEVLLGGVANEAASATDTASVVASLLSSHTAAAAASSTQAATTAFAVARTEAAAANSTQSATVQILVSLAEAAAAGSTQSSVIITAVVRSETASADSLQSVTSAFAVAGSETASATDTPTAGLGVQAATDEAAVAGSNQDAEMGAVGVDVEEPASAADTSNSTRTQSAGATEVAGAASTQSVQADFVAAATEAASAADSASATQVMPVAASEAAAAGSQQSAILTIVVTQDEAGAATSSQSVLASFVAGGIEVAAAADSPSATLVMPVVVTEATAAEALQSVVINIVAAILEAASAGEASTALVVPAAGITIAQGAIDKLTEIWARLELDPGRPVVITASTLTFGQVSQAISKDGAERTGPVALSAENPTTMIDEIWKRLGLDPANPLVQSDAVIQAGAIVLTVDETSGTITVTRQ